MTSPNRENTIQQAMGEARRRRNLPQIIYHHTSTLRTNQLWMAGEILPEGQMPSAIHPKLGEVHTNAFFRRAMHDFPPVVWLTSQIAVPPCLTQVQLRFVSNETGEEIGEADIDPDFANAIALNRVSLGFHPDEIGAVPWPLHQGFNTAEGAALNESAYDVGDDPLQWWVSEAPVDLMKMVEIRASRSMTKPKLERQPEYLGQAKQMVEMCRSTPGVFIPPTWLKPEQAEALAKAVGVPLRK